jgi:hypothetical protein
MRKRWKPEDIALLCDLYDIMTMPELAVRFGVTHEAIKSQIGDLQLKRQCKGIDYVRFPGSAKPCEVLLISELYPKMPAYKLVKFLPGRDVRFVTRTVFKHQVHRDDEQSAKVNKKNRGRFKKGQKSWNEGTHYKAGGRSAETRFVPGQAPPNVLPPFTTIQRADKKGKAFMMIKVPGIGMVFLNRWTWEQAHGQIPPPKMLVCHLDGNPLNCDITNLVLRTRAENARLTGTNNRNNEYRSKKLSLIAVTKRIENAKALPGDSDLYYALRRWVEDHEANRAIEVEKKKAKVTSTRKAKIKQVKAAPEKVKPPKIVKVVAETKVKADKSASKAEADQRRLEARAAKESAAAERKLAAEKAKRQRVAEDADEQARKAIETDIRKQVKRNQERTKARRIIEDGVRKIDTSMGRTAAASWLRFEIDKKTIKMVKPANVEAFKAKHPNAKQLFN